jgi:hypothetical protein
MNKEQILGYRVEPMKIVLWTMTRNFRQQHVHESEVFVRRLGMERKGSSQNAEEARHEKNDMTFLGLGGNMEDLGRRESCRENIIRLGKIGEKGVERAVDNSELLGHGVESV